MSAPRPVHSEKEERRVLPQVVLYREDEAGKASISGYASVVNEETVIGGGMWGFREKIAPGAFAEAIGRDDVRALFNHDPNLLLGRTASGTLRLKEDKKGLHYEVDLPDTVAAKDVKTLIQRGDVSGSSFGFIVDDDEWDESEVKAGKLPLRTITKVSLFDVSPVTFPAYEGTSVSARAKNDVTALAEARQRAADVEAKERLAAARALIRLERARQAIKDVTCRAA